MNFTESLDKILDGNRVTKTEWKDKRHYGLLKEGILQIHKAGEAEETLHPWILSEADMIGEDFELLL